MNQITLTKGQASAATVIRNFIYSGGPRTLVLKGYAGTGKTTLIQEVVRSLEGDLRVAFTAPTNKATKVLREMAYSAGVNVEHTATIYSLLGLVLKPDGHMKKVRQSDRGGSVYEYDLVVVDECSMISKELMKHIKHSLEMFPIKFLFMGDPLQLPPIYEDRSLSFTEADVSVELTQIVRQAEGNPIIGLTQAIRQAISDEDCDLMFESAKDADGHGVYVLPKAKWEAWMRAGFSSQAYADDGDSFRAVAWRNDTVKYLNKKVRQALYKEEAAYPFIVGEKVLTASVVQGELRSEALAAIDSEGVVRAVEEVDHPWTEKLGLGTFKVYHLSVWFEESGIVDCFVLHPDSAKDYGRALDSVASEARKQPQLWDLFWTFKDSFHDIRPAHAITSHRSQGSTYDNVFVDVQDIFGNRNREERLKSLYVSCSRARYNLMLLV